MFRVLPIGIAFFPLLSSPLSYAAQTETTNQRIQISEQPDRLRVEVDGQLFTEYRFKDVPRPYFYPLIGPGGEAMTRNWPMKTTPNEEHDHPHHRSLWFTHGSVNGHDFWSEEKDFGKIVHDGFTEVASGKDSGVIRSRNKWAAADGKMVCTDDRTFRVYAPRRAGEQIFDYEITLHASEGELRFGDTKEGTMGVRLAETMRLKGKVGHGHIVNSAGQRDDDTWGKRADWCDYYGPVDGKTVGIAIFDHPHNPRHPTWWHVRDYGLFAANPFGQHDFEKLSDKKAGDLVVPAGQSITFRYRFYLHQGDESEAQVARRYKEYAESSDQVYLIIKVPWPVTVTVSDPTKTHFYSIDGEVKRPDHQIYTNRVSVLKAIALAGGFTDFAGKGAVVLTRADGNKQVINCARVQYPVIDPEVFPGDSIYVPRRGLLW